MDIYTYNIYIYIKSMETYGNIYIYNLWKIYGNIWKYIYIIYGESMEVYIYIQNLWKHMETYGTIYTYNLLKIYGNMEIYVYIYI